MDSSIRVAVVVLNYKGIEDTIKCIASLSRQTYKNFIIVAIENGSYDGSAEKFKELQKQYDDQLVTLYNDKNLGFTGGVNTGIRWALKQNYDYVALFNNDAVADKKWLESLVGAAVKQQTGITTGLLLLGDGKKIDSTGDWYSKWGLPFPRNRGDKTSDAPSSEFVTGATGGASLYNAKMLRDIGMFDEDFFAYYEDVDVSLRAHLAGWKIYYTKDAVAYHNQGSTANRMASGFAVYQTFKNLPLVYIKNTPLSQLLPIGIRFYPAYWLMLGNAIKRGSGVPALKGALMSIFLGIKKLPIRWRIQHNKKVDTDYFKSLLWNDLPPEQSGLRKLRGIFLR